MSKVSHYCKLKWSHVTRGILYLWWLKFEISETRTVHLDQWFINKHDNKHSYFPLFRLISKDYMSRKIILSIYINNIYEKKTIFCFIFLFSNMTKVRYRLEEMLKVLREGIPHPWKQNTHSFIIVFRLLVLFISYYKEWMTSAHNLEIMKYGIRNIPWNGFRYVIRKLKFVFSLQCIC